MTNTSGTSSASFNATLRRKVAIYISVSVLLVFGLLLTITIASLTDQSENDIRQRELAKFASTAEKLSIKLSDMEALTTRLSRFVSDIDVTQPEVVFSLVSTNVESDPLIFGSAIAYEPDSFASADRLFSPYAYREAGSIATMDIGNISATSGYDYASGEHDWYSLPQASGMAQWSAPYVDDGAGNILMTTYSSPFYKDGRFNGVTTIDIALDTVFSHLDLVTESDYMIAEDGQFIYHPEPSRILDGTVDALHESYDPQQLDTLLALSRTEPHGSLLISGSDGQKNWAFFYRLPSNNWTYLKFVNVADATSPAYTQWSTLLGVAALCIGILLILIWRITGVITRNTAP